MTTLRDAIANAHVIDTPAPSQVFLSDVIDIDILKSHMENGIINRQFNADQTLEIYKYSKGVGSIHPWDETNILTRGLIVDTVTGEVVARGFNKFFSINQYGYFDIEVDPGDRSIVMPKEDGSLGIAYYHDGQWGVSTLLSFQSEQAEHATELFRSQYGNVTPPDNGVTMLFEIIYPDNRIVRNYGKEDKLILVGGADKYGRWINPDDIDFDGYRVPTETMTVEDVLNIPDPNDTQEGHVFYTESGLLVKHKFLSYLQLHKAKYSITPIFVWETLKNGTYFDVLGDTPDEFQSDIVAIGKKLTERKDSLVDEMNALVASMPEGLDRKHRAIWINEHAPQGTVRSMAIQSAVAGKDYESTAWDAVRPVGNKL